MRIDITYPLSTIQQPLFADLPGGMTQMPFRASCWKTGNERESLAERDPEEMPHGCHPTLAHGQPGTDAMSRLFRMGPRLEDFGESKT
jgi:hypothetical protein